jgi:hypothetical protein
MKTTIELAREAGNDDLFDAMQVAFLERFAELVRADEREQGQKWFDAVTAQHKQEILAEREACAELVYNSPPSDEYESPLKAVYDAIRARGKT